MAEGAWDVYSSMNQQDLSAATQTENQLFAAHPAHLTRALYIPRHDEDTASFTIYDVSDRYAAATTGLPVGSAKYVVALGIMSKPQGEATAETPRAYDVRFGGEDDSDGVVGSVRRHAPPLGTPEMPVEVELAIPPTSDNAAVLTFKNDIAGTPAVPVSTSYPIEPSQTRDGTFKHPYFTFRIPDKDDRSLTFEWQIHPQERSRILYTLVRNPERRSTLPDGDDVRAIYHHVGVGASLSLAHSEGILLVPGGLSPKAESATVGSVLGMLWHLRDLRGPLGVKGQISKAKDSTKQRFGSLKGLLGRRG